MNRATTYLILATSYVEKNKLLQFLLEFKLNPFGVTKISPIITNKKKI